MTKQKSVALVGTRGVPAAYGGFETCVEEVGQRLARDGMRVRVYCRAAKDEPRPATHLGMELVYRPALRRRALETLSHTLMSILHIVTHRVQAVIVFNAANAIWLPLLWLMRIPVAVHVDGLEWRRGKWGPIGQLYYRYAESLAVRWSNALISDAQAIADYYADEFGRETIQLAYGAPRAERTDGSRLAELDLTPGEYHLVVARFERENHVLEIIEGYCASRATLPLVVVGSAPYSADYTKAVHAAADERVRFVGGVWDQALLDDLYQHSATYLHGHSVGGTNPSLLRAMGAGSVCLAYDVVFNREVLGVAGRFFADPAALGRLIEQVEASEDAPAWSRLASERAKAYCWEDVSAGYATMIDNLIARRHSIPRASVSVRRRRSTWSSERRLRHLVVALVRR